MGLFSTNPRATGSGGGTTVLPGEASGRTVDHCILIDKPKHMRLSAAAGRLGFPTTEASRVVGTGLGSYRMLWWTFPARWGDRVRRRPPEWTIAPQLRKRLREVRDTWRVSKKDRAGTVPESWLEWEWGLGP